ncbi:MAG: hypothetical protein A3B82_06035 [Methylophilales bacterium RIFCSPHIGHO2_02_FULL_57_10]|nr:MAG: hypothetical protein A3B82_06035 [Methylophilales bacterium RIFCSPHIGHO2_02_FULL_57_10]
MIRNNLFLIIKLQLLVDFMLGGFAGFALAFATGMLFSLHRQVLEFAEEFVTLFLRRLAK